ncbi:exported hypothetical protein [Nitrospira lenta]|uniref:Lipoprotein n=1 Tax=Nitrospira lenta TaxID=1436998 RepID=A0A330L9G1_9BACT|nr:exported hypothetical protein [Nitrospira lenta]
MIRLVSVVSILGLALWSQGCAGMSSQQSTGVPAQQMISSHDHPHLANYYADQAQKLREKAKQWEFAAGLYEKHPEPDATGQHAARSPQTTRRRRMKPMPWLRNTERCAHTAWSSRQASYGPIHRVGEP